LRGDKGSDVDRVLDVEPVVVFASFVFQVFQCAREDEEGSHRREKEKSGSDLFF